MATMTIDLPEPLVNQLKKHNVSNSTLDSITQELLENWLLTQFPNSTYQVIADRQKQTTLERWRELNPTQSDLSTSFIEAQTMEDGTTDIHKKLQFLKDAATDARFLDDLNETMADFATVDAEWWEPDK